MWEFLIATTQLSQMPQLDRNEIALWGRSNVGKSTLINALANRRIAHTSSAPGKTRTINFLQTEKGQIIVDLPGYGYARVDKQQRKFMDNMVVEYICYRGQLSSLLLLIDSFVGYTRLDLEIIDYLKNRRIPFYIVLTKIDKCGQSQLQKSIRQTRELGLESLMHLASSRTRRGIIEIRELVDKLLL